jgi:LmbE family N-acetylglucosaminyl deacetylase
MQLRSLDDARQYNHVIIAPHLDDAVLSCGGQIAQYVAQGARVLAVTLCAATPRDDQLTPYAQHLHSTYGLGDDPMAGRRQEDVDALAILGCDGLHLDQLDAPYRMEAYGQRGAVFGRPVADDPLASATRIVLGRLQEQQPSARLYLPLGVGMHVDHQIVCAEGRAAHTRGASIVWYEDAPYAVQYTMVQQRLNDLGEPLEPHIVLITTALERKLAAIAAYGSQIAKLFRDRPMAEVMTEYAEAVTGTPGHYGERLWTRQPTTGNEGHTGPPTTDKSIRSIRSPNPLTALPQPLVSPYPKS